jgi:hypothetical protein
MTKYIQNVVDTRMYALRIRPKSKEGMFHQEGFSGIDYARRHETRFSIYSYIIYFCGSLISWMSKSSKSVTLSSTEAEYFDRAHARQCINFNTLCFNMSWAVNLNKKH